MQSKSKRGEWVMRKLVSDEWDAKKDCQAGARTRKGPTSSRRAREGRELDQEDRTVSSNLPHLSSRREVRFGLSEARAQRPGGIRSEEELA
jgi:hypothetical protein